MVALIGQKLITDIANDAMHYSRLRQSGTSSSSAGPTATSTMGGKSATAKKTTLSLEDLASALAEHGINIKRPAYYT